MRAGEGEMDVETPVKRRGLTPLSGSFPSMVCNLSLRVDDLARALAYKQGPARCGEAFQSPKDR